MLKYNYELLRNEYDTELTDKQLQIKKFTPTFPTELANISSIRGRNSKGKSTLLHIIALGLYGLKEENIHKSLTEKMEALIHSNYQNLVFNFVIENTQNNTKIVSKKQYSDSDEIEVYEINENGKKIPFSFETFRNKYKLIYDIPNNPIGRLNDLISELEFRQTILGNHVMQLNSGIRNVIQQIKDSRDSKKIEEIENKKNKLITIIDEDTKCYEKLKKDLSLFKTYTFFKYYIEYKDIKYKANIELKKLEKQSKDSIKEVKRQKKANKEDFNKGLGYINEIIGNINELAYLIKKNIGREKKNLYHMSNLEKLKIKTTMLDEDRNETIIRALEYYENLFKNEELNLSSSDKYREADMYKQVIEILNDYINLDVVIPGVEKNINDFIKILKNEYKKYEGLGIEKENIEKIMDLIDDTKSRREYFIDNVAKKMKEYIRGLNDPEADKLTEEELNIITINKLRNDINIYEEKITSYRNKVIRINEECEDILVRDRLNKLKNNQIIKDYLIWEEEQLEEKINALEEELNEKKRELEINRTRLNNYNKDLKLLESKEEHKYIDDYDFLNELFEVTRKLSGKILNDFTNYLKIIREKKKNTENESYQKYGKQVAKYLAKRVGTIRYTDGISLSVESINLVSGEIRVKDGRIIRVNDLGVGHGQAAYLKGVLNSSDNKKIIALIDETAMMDNETLETIIDKMRDLYKEGKLLLGLIVRQDEFEKVESLI